MAFELEQELLYVLFALLFGFTVPRVHLLTHLILLHSFNFFDVKLVFQGCLVFANSFVKVVVEVLLLNTLLKLSTLLSGQVSEANLNDTKRGYLQLRSTLKGTYLVFKCIDPDFEQETFSSV